MADSGKIVTKGLHAGAIKYVITKGLVPNPSGGIVNACLITRGLGAQNQHRPVLHGMSTNAGAGGPGSFYVFGELVVR